MRQFKEKVIIGMRHTEVVSKSLTERVAHRSKQDICVPQMSSSTVRAVGDLKGTPPNPRKKYEI